MYYTVSETFFWKQKFVCALLGGLGDGLNRNFFILVIVYIFKVLFLILCFPVSFQSGLGVFNLTEKIAVFRIYSFCWCDGRVEDT